MIRKPSWLKMMPNGALVSKDPVVEFGNYSKSVYDWDDFEWTVAMEGVFQVEELEFVVEHAKQLSRARGGDGPGAA